MAEKERNHIEICTWSKQKPANRENRYKIQHFFGLPITCRNWHQWSTNGHCFSANSNCHIPIAVSKAKDFWPWNLRRGRQCLWCSKGSLEERNYSYILVNVNMFLVSFWRRQSIVNDVNPLLAILSLLHSLKNLCSTFLVLLFHD